MALETIRVTKTVVIVFNLFISFNINTLLGTLLTKGMTFCHKRSKRELSIALQTSLLAAG